MAPQSSEAGQSAQEEKEEYEIVEKTAAIPRVERKTSGDDSERPKGASITILPTPARQSVVTEAA
jgi:hypothetical protein